MASRWVASSLFTTLRWAANGIIPQPPGAGKCPHFFISLLKSLSSTSLHPRTAFSASEWKRNTDHSDGGPPDGHRKLPSSAAEDRAVLLGFAMMGFAVLMFFLFGIAILQPFMLR